jgi:glucosamine--fructose-6-phosphate aminotransferase (isomerizing)
MIALKIGYIKGSISQERYMHLLKELNEMPEKVAWTLKHSDNIKLLAEKYKDAHDFLYLGRGYNFPVALEGALKLKEISYIHAEGYPAAEMKHGPIALVDENLPVVFVATKDTYHEKVVSNMQEIKARKGKVISVITEGDEMSASLSDDIMIVPEADEIVAPMLSVVPLQLLAYYIGVAKGCDVDKPRNLAKSVTVE